GGSAVGLWADRVAGRFMPDAALATRPGRIVMRLATAIGGYRDHGHILGRVMALSFVVQVVRILLAWAIGHGLGLTVPLKYYWVFMPLNILVILLPLSIGGFGLPQGTMIWTLGPLGVDPTRAFLLSTLFVAAGIIGNLPGAWMYLTGRRPVARP
ncbi:MAG: lysylphosphatidylglycerol synthase domain-containing protein, partial [Vicinamibacterales bacterium]